MRCDGRPQSGEATWLLTFIMSAGTWGIAMLISLDEWLPAELADRNNVQSGVVGVRGL